MLVICFGMAKSGSTLAFELTKGVLTTAGHDQSRIKSDGFKTRRNGNYIAKLTRESVTDIVSTIGPDRIVAAKTHKCFEDGDFAWYEDMQAQRKIQVVASYRDPRDMCLSLLDHGARSREAGQDSYAKIKNLHDAARLISKAIPKFRRWASLTGSARLYYDTVAFAPDTAIEVLEGALGVASNREEARKHAFEDAFTQRNKAQKSRFEEELNADEQDNLREQFADFIDRVCHQNDEQWFSSYRSQMLAAPASAP